MTKSEHELGLRDNSDLTKSTLYVSGIKLVKIFYRYKLVAISPVLPKMLTSNKL